MLAAAFVIIARDAHDRDVNRLPVP